MNYKTLEQKIQELWKSCGMEVLEEKFRKLKNGRFKWTIIARRQAKQKEKEDAD